MKKFWVVGLLVLGSGLTARADNVLLTGKKISNIIAYDDFVILRFSPAATTAETGCPKTDQVYLSLQEGKGQPMYTAALAAALSGKTVELKIKGGVCDDLWKAATLYQVNVAF